MFIKDYTTIKLDKTTGKCFFLNFTKSSSETSDPRICHVFAETSDNKMAGKCFQDELVNQGHLIW